MCVEGGGVLVKHLRPDRMNYSDVSICKLGLVAQPEHPDLYRTGGNGKGSLHSYPSDFLHVLRIKWNVKMRHT